MWHVCLTNARIDIVVGMLLYIYALMHLKARDELRSQRTKATRDSCPKAGGVDTPEDG